MANRPVIYELHIRPLFRELDRMHMLLVTNGKLDLWDYDSVRKYSTPPPAPRGKIGDNITSGMPTEDTGGPWPSEWVEVFNRWVDTQYGRLELPTTQSITASKFPTSDPGIVNLIIRVTGALPSGPTYRVWVDFENNRKAPFEFVVYQEAGGGSFVDNFDYSTDFPFSAPSTIQTIVVRDANGSHDVPVT